MSGLLPIDDKTWAIYGSIPGEMIAAELDDRVDAEWILERMAAAEQETVTP